MNREIITSNIREAREQLEEIERQFSSSDTPGEAEFFVMLQHAYHHLNVAWNARAVATERYASMSDEDFNAWGKFPPTLDDYHNAAEDTERE